MKTQSNWNIFLDTKGFGNMNKHRNSQKRIYGNYIYFITCNTEDRTEYFKDDILCDFWIEELKLAKQDKQFNLYAFCLNYEHFHFIIKPNNHIANYSQIMHFLKRNSSQNINKILGYTQFKISNEGDNAHCRLHWKFDKIIYKFHQKYIIKYGEKFHHPKFKWQKSFHDHIIRNEHDFNYHWNYTMYNFKKHNLPENWKYTGLNFPELIDDYK